MMRWIPVGLLTLVFGVALTLHAADAKFTIKDVMKKAMGKGKLCEKLAGGTATKEEKADAIELFTEMGKNKPPKGDEASWKAKTDALLTAAKAAAAGEAGADAKLKKAADCGACHSAHK